jgi:hypothetical protein
MDRKLHALVKRDVVTGVVRIDVQGSLAEESRPSLVHLIRRVRSMGIRSHIRVDLSQAAFVESSALAGLRHDLNAVDGATTPPGMNGSGVSLNLTAHAGGGLSPAGHSELSLAITDELTEGFANEAKGKTQAPPGAMFAQPLTEYSDEELLVASDSIFALLDTSEAFAGSDLLARYKDIGEEIARRDSAGAIHEPPG